MRISNGSKRRIQKPPDGILGEPRVNVLLVNLALDRQFGRPAPLPAPEKKDTKDTVKEGPTPDQPVTPNNPKQ